MTSKSMLRAAAFAGLAGIAFSFAAPASAERTLCTSGYTPAIDLEAQACVFNPEVFGNDQDTLENVTQAIFEATGDEVTLSLYGKSEADEDLELFKFDPGGDPNGEMEVEWEVLDGTLINYISVKSANEFKVYRLPGLGAFSGTASSLDLLDPNGKNQPAISHISFWTAAVVVPEPGTWAMLILGFGAVGGALRRSRRRPVELKFV